MRVLLLINQFPPDVNTSGRLISQVGEELLSYGHDVFVITAFPHYEQFRVWQEYRGRLAQFDAYHGMSVVRLPVFASGKKQNMLHRLANYLSFNALATLATLAVRRSFDVALCPNGSFFTGVSAYASGLITGTPFVYNVQDLYPEVPAQAGQLKRRSSVNGLEYIARFMYHTAAHITVITPTMRQRLIDKGVPAQNITVVPNFVDTDFIRPLPKVNDFSQRLNLANKFVITHAGNLGLVYDFETLLAATTRLRDYRDILVLIVGDGVAKPALERIAQAPGFQNVRFLPFQPLDDLPWLRAASDVQVSLYKYGAAKNSMPSKVYEIMASGRPLLASAEPGSEVRSLVETTGCGLCVDPQDVDQLTQAILALYHDPARREQMAQRGREYAVRQFSRQAVGAQYNDLLQRVATQQQ